MGNPEPEQRLQPLGRAFVGHRIDERLRLADLAVNGGESRVIVAPQGAMRRVSLEDRCRGLERQVACRVRRRTSLSRKPLGRCVISRRRPFSHEHVGQRADQTGLGWVEELSLTLGEATRFLVVLEPEALELSERLNHPNALVRGSGRKHGQDAPQHVPCVRRTACRNERSPLGTEQRETLLAVLGAVRQQPDSGRVPPCRRRGGLRRGLVGGRYEETDCREVSSAGGALDVVGALRRTGAARVKQIGRAPVGRESPAGARGLVDGAPHERVAEPKSPPVVQRAHEVGCEKLVDGRQGGAVVDSRGHRGEIRLERIPSHRSSLQHLASQVRQCGEFTQQGVLHTHRNARQAGATASVAVQAGTRQLQEVEGVASALAVQPLAHRGPCARR